MIIKKKHTQINKKEKEAAIDTDIITAVNNEVKKVNEETTTKQSEVSNEEDKTNIQDTNNKEDELNTDDFLLSLDNIKFEQREERREGTRRRGYRRTQDRNILSRAQQEALSIKELAKQEGYEEGIKKSQKDLSDLKTKLIEFNKYKDEVYEKISGCIIDISLEIAKKIIKKEIETDREYIFSMVKSILDEVNKTENTITLKVMPKDAEIVKDKIPQIFAEESFDAKITVLPSKEIKEGGVIIETSNGIIDAAIETQFAILEKALQQTKEEK